MRMQTLIAVGFYDSTQYQMNYVEAPLLRPRAKMPSVPEVGSMIHFEKVRQSDSDPRRYVWYRIERCIWHEFEGDMMVDVLCLKLNM